VWHVWFTIPEHLTISPSGWLSYNVAPDHQRTEVLACMICLRGYVKRFGLVQKMLSTRARGSVRLYKHRRD